jgi:hypothetical protein
VAIKRLLVDLFLEANERAPNEIILDLDATDDPVHGEQEGRFFHGYYDCYCYLVLVAITPHPIITHMERHTFLCAKCNQTKTYMLQSNRAA